MNKKVRNKSKPRGRASKAPPFLNLDKAIDIARFVYEKGGGSMDEVHLAKALKNAPTSSKFHRKIASARSFGLLTTQRDKERKHKTFRTTNIAKLILAPHLKGDESIGKYEALKSVPEFKMLLDAYKDAVPEREYIANKLGDEANIPLANRDDWVERFLKSCKDAGIIHEISGKEYFSGPGVEENHTGGEFDESGKGKPPQDPPPPPPPPHETPKLNVFEFPPTTLVGGTVSNISFVDIDKITLEGIEQFTKVSEGIAEFLKAHIPIEKGREESVSD